MGTMRVSLSSISEGNSYKKPVVINKFKENSGPETILCTEKGNLNKLKFKIIFINRYSKFNVIFYTYKMFKWFLKL